MSTAFDHDLVQWVWDRWEALNRETGPHWHLLMPSRVDSFELNENRADSIGLLNINLVDEANSIYRINRKEFPVIVFDTFDENRNQPYLKFPRRPTDSSLRDMFLDLSDSIRDAQQQQSQSISADSKQADMMEAIVHKIARRRRISHLLGIAPSTASFALRLLS